MQDGDKHTSDEDNLQLIINNIIEVNNKRSNKIVVAIKNGRPNALCLGFFGIPVVADVVVVVVTRVPSGSVMIKDSVGG
jgi:hypothetical protein